MRRLTFVPSNEATRLLDALVEPLAHGEGAVVGLVERLRRMRFRLQWPCESRRCSPCRDA